MILAWFFLVSFFSLTRWGFSFLRNIFVLYLKNVVYKKLHAPFLTIFVFEKSETFKLTRWLPLVRVKTWSSRMFLEDPPLSRLINSKIIIPTDYILDTIEHSCVNVTGFDWLYIISMLENCSKEKCAFIFINRNRKFEQSEYFLSPFGWVCSYSWWTLSF